MTASPLLSVRNLLLAIFMIMAGSGFLTTLLAVRLEAQGASAIAIGLVTTSYFAGLTIGSLRAPLLIAQIGHIRAFAAFVTIFSASSLSYAIADQFWIWALLRLVDGFMIAGVFVCLESWLNGRASRQSRSTILAAYMIALYAGQAAGQFLLNLDETPALPFMLSAILLSLALLPVLVTKLEQPPLEKVTPFRLHRLYDASPLGMVGVLVTGTMLGAFYGLGAVYVQRIGMQIAEVALFTSGVIAGGIALQWPLGRLSDRFDRRRVIIGCFVLTALVSVAIAVLAVPPAGTIMLGAVFGGFAFALYPLCVAHANDHLEEAERIGASSGLVLTYSAGAIAGPMVGSAAIAAAGPAGLFWAIAALAGLGSLFGFWRAFRRAPVAAAEQQDFTSLPRTTPMAAVLEAEES